MHQFFDMGKAFFAIRIIYIVKLDGLLHKIYALSRVTIPPIFRRAIKVGPNFGIDRQIRHRNMLNTAVKSAVLTPVPLQAAGGLDCPRIM